jgi:hypothetical protein
MDCCKTVLDFGLLCPKFLALIKNSAYFMLMGSTDKDGDQIINIYPSVSGQKKLT